jgi:hypothetical protein
MRLVACWDGELDLIGALSRLSYRHERPSGPKKLAHRLPEAVERRTGRNHVPPRE